MANMEKKSYFASPGRSSQQDINLENSLLLNESGILDILGSISGIAAILNENRQIVYSNEELIKLIGIDSIDKILGKRPGEAIGCIHAGDTQFGCGTSEACSFCGSVNAIIESQVSGKKTVKETRITTITDNQLQSWDLKVTSSPIIIRGIKFYVFMLEDISGEKRSKSLERIFFHDILNSAGSISGLLTVLREGLSPEETREIIELSEEASRDLVEEIMLHRQIRDAENGDLQVNIEKLVACDLFKSSVAKISRHEIAKGKRVFIVDHSSDYEIFTDRILLQRVLMNMLKNALEATEVGGVVYAEVENLQETIRFRVKNESVMPREVMLQVFQRSFSTKGNGRGIGTYSIKLLTENYLNGKAGFSSKEGDGTQFWIDLPKKS